MKKIDPIFLKQELQKVHNFFESNMYEKVIEKTKILLKKDAYQTPFYNYMALSYRQTNQAEKAKQFYNETLSEVSVKQELDAFFQSIN